MSLRKYLPLLFFVLLFFSFFYFWQHHSLTLDSLIQNHGLFLLWKSKHSFLTVVLYILCYSTAVCASFPGGPLFFSLAGGLLFGPFPGAFYVIFSATLGSTLLYLAVKFAWAEKLRQSAGPWLQTFEQGFQKNAFYYLLFLRLIPVFPFFLVNIASGLLAVPLPIFVTATLLGLIPGSLIYTMMGQNLELLLTQPQQPLMTFRFFLPLCALGILALLPILGRQFRLKRAEQYD